MEWIALKSRLLSEIAYDADSKVLHVRLRTGASRTYEDISPSMYENLRTAESPGLYFSYYIARVRDSKGTEARRLNMPLRAMKFARLVIATGAVFVSTNLFVR